MIWTTIVERASAVIGWTIRCQYRAVVALVRLYWFGAVTTVTIVILGPLRLTRRFLATIHAQPLTHRNVPVPNPLMANPSESSSVHTLKVVVVQRSKDDMSTENDGNLWKPDWTQLSKAPNSQQAQQLREAMRELSLDLPVMTLRKPGGGKGGVLVYTVQQLRVDLISVAANGDKDEAKLLMAHGTPLLVRVLDERADMTLSSYWYFESRLERELVYWAIKGAQQSVPLSPNSNPLASSQSPWLSFMERVWLIWRDQPWFQQRISARLQTILNKVTKPSFLRSIQLNRVHLPKRPPHLAKLQQLIPAHRDLIQQWQCELSWEESVKLDITVDISGRETELVVTLDDLRGPLLFSMAATPSPLMHLHFHPPGPTFHLSINTTNSSTIGIPSWVQSKLEKKIRKAIARQMVGNHSVIIDWAHIGTSPSSSTKIEKSASIHGIQVVMGGSVGSGFNSGQRTPRTPERQQAAGWGWTLGLPTATGFLTPRPSMFSSGGISRQSSVGPADGSPGKSVSSAQHSRKNSTTIFNTGDNDTFAKDQAPPPPPEKDYLSAHENQSDGSHSENGKSARAQPRQRKHRAKRKTNRPNTIVEDVD